MDGNKMCGKERPEKKELIIEQRLSFAEIRVRVISVGEDFVIVLEGGDGPHIGGCVLAVPRPSLTGDGVSCTSSVVNVCGHKDEQILRLLAEKKCKTTNRVVLCTGGFHQDQMTAEQIDEVQAVAAELAEQISKPER